MSGTQARCPHCAAVQQVQNFTLQPCAQCSRAFYPAPLQDEAVVARRKSRRLLRERAQEGVERRGSHYQGIFWSGVLVLGIGCAQLYFGAVFFSGKGSSSSVVILRHEEPERYWRWTLSTWTLGLGLTLFGHRQLRRVRADFDRRFPPDPP